ncbi:hypothetical protein SRHO_G00206890 [Serrasalmus rhombeus]
MPAFPSVTVGSGTLEHFPTQQSHQVLIRPGPVASSILIPPPATCSGHDAASGQWKDIEMRWSLHESPLKPLPAPARGQMENAEEIRQPPGGCP